jgi:hypothetical protein
VSNNSDNRSILLHLLKLQLDFLLASISVILLGILGEGLLLALAPVLVEPSPHFFTQVLSPDRVESAKATRGLHVCHKSNNDKGWGLDDGNSLTGFLLVELCTTSVHSTITSHAKKTLSSSYCSTEYTSNNCSTYDRRVHLLEPGFSTSRTM